MLVDGFRFDLASIMARNSDGSIDLSDPPLLSQISADPFLRNAILIAEPWDIGTYQLGRAFRGLRWSQWNGKYRDTVQRYLRGDSGTIGDMAGCLYGSADLFPDSVFDARHPWQSINYYSSHDGFSLYDMVSYNNRRNWANGEQNRDGHDDRSWN
jgi:glycogen operon protein